MNVHFIAIGGSAMHNLAIALHLKGYTISGSDDQIFEPSRGRLKKHGLLPESEGWDEQKISKKTEAVIVGMHAREDNPELLTAQNLGIRIYSYPEYIYEQTKDKIRVVIGGSHGKTSITSMILHVLNYVQLEADYMVGAQLEGFDCMVRLSSTAKIAILEGDEYLSSPIDRRPKFHLYRPNIALISGIAWDHINVFPTFENYVEQFKIFINKIEPKGCLVYCSEDDTVDEIASNCSAELHPYSAHPHEIVDGVTYLYANVNGEKAKVPLEIFGEHNLQNLTGAMEVCLQLGVSSQDFYEAISSFGGASKRLELVKNSKKSVMFKDFAHSPSKLKATTNAVKQQYPDRQLVACMELHTFSSLNETFLPEYDGAMNAADKAFVYFNPETAKHKKLKVVSVEEIKSAFNSDQVEVYTDSDELQSQLRKIEWENKNLLMMSSGNFDGIDFKELSNQLF